MIGHGRRQGSLPLDFEAAQVDVAGLGVPPAQIPGGHDQSGLLAQHLTQVVQLTAEVGQRLRVGRIRPERPGDVLPGLGCPSMDGQKGDQGNRP